MSETGLRPLPKETLEKLFKIVRYDKRAGKWKRKAEAARMLGISRPTIDKWLAQYPKGMPEKPRMTEPRYFQKWRESDCYKKIVEFFWDRTTNKLSNRGSSISSVLRDAWRMRGEQDPLTFNLADFLFFWGTSTQDPPAEFIDPVTNKIYAHKASALRWAMMMSPDVDIRALIKDPRFLTKGLKREAGAKAFWYLETSEIVRVVNCIREIDTLMLCYCGILMGGRISALLPFTPEKIHRQLGIIEIYEVKIEKWVRKRFYEPEMSFLLQYITDFNIGSKQRLFASNEREYNLRFKRASVEAGLPENKLMTSHMLKHTCVTQMRLHGVELGTVSKWVNTDPQTLLDYYVGGTDQQIDEQIGGIAPTEHRKTWRELVIELTGHFKARYNYLKPLAQKINGFKRG